MSSTSAQNRSRVFNIIILILVAAAGMAFGFWIANGTSWVGAANTEPEPVEISVDDLVLPERLQPGKLLPDVRVVTAERDSLWLGSFIRDQYVVVAFLSSGCEPCYSWLDFVEVSALFKQGIVRPVLIADDPAAFAGRTRFPVYAECVDDIANLGIQVHPFIVGVNEDGTVAFAHNGFRGHIDEEYILDSFHL